MSYPFQNIEPKWQKYWDQHKTFKAVEKPEVPKSKRRYILDMFPIQVEPDSMLVIQKAILQQIYIAVI